MNPAEASAQEMVSIVAQHDATVKRHEAALIQQEALMEKHSQLLSELMTSMRQLSDSLRQRPTTSPEEASTPTPVIHTPQPQFEPRLPPPQRFSGDPETCEGFITQCDLTFKLQPSTFPSDQAKIAYILTLLSGKALAWATAIWNAKSPCCTNYSAFVKELRRVFNHPLSGREASKHLLTLCQGGKSAAEYAIQFRTIAAGAGWNDEALIVCFQNGLSEALKDELATRDPAKTLESLIDQAILLDNRLRERRLTPCYVPSRSPNLPNTPYATESPQFSEPDSPEPMQLGRARLTLQERTRRMKSRLCLYCGGSGHFRSDCPELKENSPSQTVRRELSRE